MAGAKREKYRGLSVAAAKYAAFGRDDEILGGVERTRQRLRCGEKVRPLDRSVA
jgi:hypothetical protein